MLWWRGLQRRAALGSQELLELHASPNTLTAEFQNSPSPITSVVVASLSVECTKATAESHTNSPGPSSCVTLVTALTPASQKKKRFTRTLLPTSVSNPFIPIAASSVRLLTVDCRIKVHMDLQADKSPVVVKGPFFP
jgi:hypothetical protein